MLFRFVTVYYLHLPLNPAAINSNHTFNKVLSGAQALIALLTCCRVIALTLTNCIYGPICCCLLSPACIAPSRLRWLSALFDSTHGGQNFRGHHASDFAQNEIDVCWTERSGQSMWTELSGENLVGAHVGVRSPRSTAQSHSRPLRSFPLPAHLQFHPAPVKSLHARSHLNFLCMPNTCRFQPKPYWDTLSAWRTWSGFVA